MREPIRTNLNEHYWQRTIVLFRNHLWMDSILITLIIYIKKLISMIVYPHKLMQHDLFKKSVQVFWGHKTRTSVFPFQLNAFYLHMKIHWHIQSTYSQFVENIYCACSVSHTHVDPFTWKWVSIPLYKYIIRDLE